MNIYNIKQLDNGIQKKPYADHIYHWNLSVRGTEEEVLEFCQKYLKNAKMEEKEYWTAYRDDSKGFNEHMEIICGGYYSLTNNADGTWDYIVRYEYFD